jgi:hypothetical protein
MISSHLSAVPAAFLLASVPQKLTRSQRPAVSHNWPLEKGCFCLFVVLNCLLQRALGLRQVGKKVSKTNSQSKNRGWWGVGYCYNSSCARGLSRKIKVLGLLGKKPETPSEK